jgi:hypothetical protein
MFHAELLLRRAQCVTGRVGESPYPARGIFAAGLAAVTTYWTIKDSTGRHLPHFIGSSRLEVGRKIVPTHFDVFRLHVSASYREAFERALLKVLNTQGWQIVRTAPPGVRRRSALAGR